MQVLFWIVAAALMLLIMVVISAVNMHFLPAILIGGVYGIAVGIIHEEIFGY